MTFRTGIATYTILGVTIARRLDNPEHEPWFYPDVNYTKDMVLSSGVTPVAYLDKGSLVYPPLSFRASCLSAANRLTLIAGLWSTTTLINSRGHSGTVTIVKARPINETSNSHFWIDLSFELRS